MEEEDIGDDGGLENLGGSGSYSVEAGDVSQAIGKFVEVNLHTCSHENAVGGCFGSNDVACEADHLGGDIYRSAAERGRDGCPITVSYKHSFLSIPCLPEKVTKSQDQDSNTRELNDILKGTVISTNQIRKHRRKSKRRKTLRKRHGRNAKDGRELPERRPVEGIVRILGWLGNEDLIRLFGADVVFFANVGHDLRSREDFDVKFILDGFACLLKLGDVLWVKRVKMVLTSWVGILAVLQGLILCGCNSQYSDSSQTRQATSLYLSKLIS